MFYDKLNQKCKLVVQGEFPAPHLYFRKGGKSWN